MGETRELHHIIGSVNHYAYGTIEAEEFSVSQRRRILAVISLVSFVGPLANFLFLPSLPEITEDLNAKSYQVTLSSAVFQLPLALFPLLWGPLSERLGRRKLYLFVTMYLIIIFYATALSPGIWSLILFRFLTGIPLAALFVLGYGVIGDIYPPESRAKAAGIMGALPLAAPLIGPLVGGILAAYFSWRYSFALEALLALGSFFLVLIFLPETFSSEDLTTFNILRPFSIMFHNWQIFTLAIMTSLSLSQCALAAFVITTATASALDLNGFIVGLILIPSGLANVIGSLVGGKLADVGRQKVGYGGRLLAAIVGTFFVLVFNICFGFTCQLDWWYPTIFTSLMALFRTIGVTGVITFCIEQDIHKSSSITAAINSTNYIMNFLVLLISPIIANAIGGAFAYGYIYLVLSSLLFLFWLTSIVIMKRNIVPVLM